MKIIKSENGNTSKVVLSNRELTTALCDYLKKNNPDYKIIGVSFLEEFVNESLLINISK